MKQVWRWWAKALGEKPSKCDRESDSIEDAIWYENQMKLQGHTNIEIIPVL
jgi:hypothetical protein